MRTGPIFVRDVIDDVRRRAAYAGEMRDTLLTAGKVLHAEEGPTISNQGKRWTGNGSPDVDGFAEDVVTIIGAMSDADRSKVWSILERYSGAGWKVNGVGAATGDVAAVNRASHETAAQMNEDGRKFWDDRARRNMHDADSSRPRLNTTTASLCAEMNAEARRFWNQDPPHG